MTVNTDILPETGRGTVRRTVEGAYGLTGHSERGQAPSVGRCASATSPRAGRIA